MSVRSATRRPRRVAFHGVSGAGFRTRVFPVASAWPTLFSVTSKGKFHGTMAPTTPAASFQIRRELSVPRRSSASGSSVSHSNSSISFVGYRSACSSGVSSCGPYVSMRGQPTSTISSSRSCARSASNASWSCFEAARAESALVDQSSRRRRAGRRRSLDASPSPMRRQRTRALFGGRVDVLERLAESASTSLPSMSIRVSGSTFGVSATGLSFPDVSPSPARRGRPARYRTVLNIESQSKPASVVAWSARATSRSSTRQPLYETQDRSPATYRIGTRARSTTSRCEADQGVIRGRISEYIPNPTFDVVARPGPWRTTSAAATRTGRTAVRSSASPCGRSPRSESRAPGRADGRAGVDHTLMFRRWPASSRSG